MPQPYLEQSADIYRSAQSRGVWDDIHLLRLSMMVRSAMEFSLKCRNCRRGDGRARRRASRRVMKTSLENLKGIAFSRGRTSCGEC